MKRPRYALATELTEMGAVKATGDASRGKGSEFATMSDMENNKWSIPEDVVECILERLSPRDVCALRSCSRFFYDVCSSDQIWIELFKQRWSCPQDSPNACRNLNMEEEAISGGEYTNMGPCCLHAIRNPPVQGWLDAYAVVHKEMKSRARRVTDLLTKCSNNESVEASDYQKAMMLLSDLGLGFYDILIHLLTPSQGVLVNLLGLHFALIHLHVQGAGVKAALKGGGVGSRQICLRWWTMGGWSRFGVRLRDEMHIRTASIDELTSSAHRDLLNVIDRGTIHEVLRVQISADFKSSAWVCRDMHSQR